MVSDPQACDTSLGTAHLIRAGVFRYCLCRQFTPKNAAKMQFLPVSHHPFCRNPHFLRQIYVFCFFPFVPILYQRDLLGRPDVGRNGPLAGISHAAAGAGSSLPEGPHFQRILSLFAIVSNLWMECSHPPPPLSVHTCGGRAVVRNASVLRQPSP